MLVHIFSILFSFFSFFTSNVLDRFFMHVEIPVELQIQGICFWMPRFEKQIGFFSKCPLWNIKEWKQVFQFLKKMKIRSNKLSSFETDQ